LGKGESGGSLQFRGTFARPRK
jgi:hypothetical protein